MKKNRIFLTFLVVLLTAAALLTACSKELPHEKERTTQEEPVTCEETDTLEEAVTEEMTAPGDCWPELPPEDLHNEVLEGDWLHSDGEKKLSFNGEDRYWYEYSDEIVGGLYKFDGVTLYLLDPQAEYYAGYLDSNGNLVIYDLDGWFSQVPGEPEP